MVNHTIDIYFYSASPPSRAALLCIRALGMKHNVKNVNLMTGEHLKPDFIKVSEDGFELINDRSVFFLFKMNPLHTVPTLNDNGFILWDRWVSEMLSIFITCEDFISIDFSVTLS